MLFYLLLTLAVAQAPHDRGAAVMGFDQHTTAHHFSLYSDGGSIAVSVKDTKEAKDTKERDAIRAHLSHIAMKFGSGDFDAPMLVHDTKDVPGIAVLGERHDG